MASKLDQVRALQKQRLEHIYAEMKTVLGEIQQERSKIRELAAFFKREKSIEQFLSKLNTDVKAKEKSNEMLEQHVKAELEQLRKKPNRDTAKVAHIEGGISKLEGEQKEADTLIVNVQNDINQLRNFEKKSEEAIRVLERQVEDERKLIENAINSLNPAKKITAGEIRVALMDVGKVLSLDTQETAEIKELKEIAAAKQRVTAALLKVNNKVFQLNLTQQTLMREIQEELQKI